MNKLKYFILLLLHFTNVFASSDQENNFSLRLQQAPLVATLQKLALEQNKNLVIDDELQGTLSLQLDNITFDNFLRVVAKSKKLNLSYEQNTYYLNAFEQAGASDVNEPKISSSIKLHFAKASDVMKSLTTGNGVLLSPEGSLSFDDRSNLILVQDTAQSVHNLKKLIAEMDKPTEQIIIEARIVTMTDESLKELGVNWGLFNPTENSHRVAGSLAANGFQNIGDQLNVNFATNVASTVSVALQLAKINGRLLDLELSALERENNVEIIASPRLLTTNKKSASIKQGTEIPYIISNGKNDSQTVEFREAVLGLDVTPHISKDNNILLDLIITQNALGPTIRYEKGEVVSIDKQEINTQVFAKDGETIVLGGVFHDTVSKAVDKVPLLGDIPLIKHLFRKEGERHQKRELVIFVTPRIVKNMSSSTLPMKPDESQKPRRKK